MTGDGTLDRLSLYRVHDSQCHFGIAVSKILARGSTSSKHSSFPWESGAGYSPVQWDLILLMTNERHGGYGVPDRVPREGRMMNDGRETSTPRFAHKALLWQCA